MHAFIQSTGQKTVPGLGGARVRKEGQRHGDESDRHAPHPSSCLVETTETFTLCHQSGRASALWSGYVLVGREQGGYIKRWKASRGWILHRPGLARRIGSKGIRVSSRLDRGAVAGLCMAEWVSRVRKSVEIC